MAELRALIAGRNASLLVRCLRQLLRIPALGYSLAIWVRNCLYDWGLKKSHRAEALVLSVGNLSVGGTGKSPAVAWLAAWFRQQDVRVAVLSRGYRELECGRNDEALELELRHPDVPHLQSPDRVESAELATNELDMQALVLDDGFQHRRLSRDIDIVLLDVSEPIAAMKVLPAGVLRESFRSLSRANVVVLTRCHQAEPAELAWYRTRVRKYGPQAIIAETNHLPKKLYGVNGEEELAHLNGKRVLACCGIGKPEAFFQTLEQAGAQVVDQRVFADHHEFTADDVKELEEWSQQHSSADLVICTMKDWVKLQIPNLGPLPLRALLIEMEFSSGLPELKKMLEDATRGLKA